MKMLIGLTGKTGSGKTSAAQILEKLGCYVADCDKIAHEVLLLDDVKDKLRAEFSDAIFNSSNNIDRKSLGGIVFSDSEKLLRLNAIMHSVIVDEAIDMCINSGRDICVLDGSELEASGAYKKCKHMIVITADDDIRLRRIMDRDALTQESAILRMRAQNDYSKEAFFINNNGDYSLLEKEITALYNKFLGELNV